MNNFDLKKFLVENKLTTASKIRKDEVTIPVDDYPGCGSGLKEFTVITDDEKDIEVVTVTHIDDETSQLQVSDQTGGPAFTQKVIYCIEEIRDLFIQDGGIQGDGEGGYYFDANPPQLALVLSELGVPKKFLTMDPEDENSFVKFPNGLSFWVGGEDEEGGFVTKIVKHRNGYEIKGTSRGGEYSYYYTFQGKEVDDLGSISENKKNKMNNFDLKKFLVENKLTTASRLTTKNSSKKSKIKENNQPEGTVLEEVTFQDDSHAENLIFTLSRVADTSVGKGDTRKLKLYEPGERVILSTPEGEEFDVTDLGTVDYLIATGEEEEYWRVGTDNDYHDYVINSKSIDGDDVMPLIENWLMRDEYLVQKDGINENDLSTQEIAPNDGSNSNKDKYLKMETAQAILSELDSEMALAELEIKKEQIQSIIQEIENKISTLEEDAGMKGFVDETAIRAKRKVVKELNRAYEQVSKLSEKMHAKRKKRQK